MKVLTTHFSEECHQPSLLHIENKRPIQLMDYLIVTADKERTLAEPISRLVKKPFSVDDIIFFTKERALLPSAIA